MKNEPVATGHAFVLLVQSAIALAIGFGWDISVEQAALLLTFTGSLVAFGTTLFVRKRVTPTK